MLVAIGFVVWLLVERGRFESALDEIRGEVLAHVLQEGAIGRVESLERI